MASFVAIDVETANAFMGSICQIGMVRFVDGQPVEEFSWLVDPQDDFDPINVWIHGIEAHHVKGQPRFADHHPALCNILSGSIAVCHTHFDRVAVQRACAAAGLESPECRWLDSARVARRTWADVAWSGYALKALAKRFDIKFRHHDACEDARAAGLILCHAIAESQTPIDEWLSRVQRSILPTGAKSLTRVGDGDGPLLGETIVFTGALEMARREASDRAAELGADVAATVTGKTTILVVGDQDLSKLAGASKSSKHRRAESLILEGQAIRILAEQDFLALQD